MLSCDACRHREAVDPQLLIFTFGEDFDVYEGYSELRSRLGCSQCGEPRPRALFYNPSQNSGPVRYDEALTSSLEFSAFVHARDAGEPPRPYRGRYRKFRR